MNIRAALWTGGAALVISVVLALGLWQESLVHTTSKAQLKRVTLWGRELRREYITAPEPVQVDLPLDKPLQYPPSVAALATKDTDSVVRAAVIGLLADRMMSPLMYQTHKLRPDGASVHSQSTFLFKRIDSANKGGIPKSWLERSLFYKSADARPMAEIVHDIIDKDRTDPASWLLRQVREVAVRRGWGRWEKRMGIPFLKRYQPDPEHADSLARERAIMDQLSRTLEAEHPVLSRALDKGIRAGIASRTKESGPC